MNCRLFIFILQHGDVHVAITCSKHHHVDVYYARRSGVLFLMHYPASIMLCESGAALFPRVIKHVTFSQRRKPPTPFQTEITFTRP
eukprot:664336-Pleurochrysis_carterae.AAC.1